MLKDLLKQKRERIADRWLDGILAGYPGDSAGFLKGEGDRFRNPVGTTVAKATREILDALIAGGGTEEIAPLLDEVVRIRAVQDFSASQAVAFVFGLKRAVREEAVPACSSVEAAREILEFEEKIDGLALAAFDSYTGSRERISQIRVKEAKDRLFLLERMHPGFGKPGAE